jgi:hypothetical protein
MTDHVPDTHPSGPATGPLALKSNLVLGPNALKWTCFHCGQECADDEAARLHFGASEHQQAGCQIDLTEYRRMEEVNRRHCEEDTELHRALHRMECEHQQALRREEEAGYAKGLRDGRRETVGRLSEWMAEQGLLHYHDYCKRPDGSGGPAWVVRKPATVWGHACEAWHATSAAGAVEAWLLGPNVGAKRAP